MQTKRLAGALALTAALAGGGVVGAVLGVPGVSSAQTSQSSDSSPSPDAPAPAPAGEHHGPRGGGPNLDAAAKALGITTDELHTQLEAGKTIAQVAADKGVDVQTVIDAMVADAQTDLVQRITDFVNNGKPAGPPDGGHGPGMRMGGPGIDAAAKALGITTDELHTQLEAGKTIAQVAADKGVDVQTVIDAMVADGSAKIDQAVTDGKLTADEAAQRKADLTQRVTDFVNNGKPAGPGGPGGPGGRHHDGPPPADAPNDSSSTSTSS